MSRRQTLDPYAVLGVARGATAEQVAEAHRRLAKRHHPDVNSDAAATERMRRINEARQMLLRDGEHRTRTKAHQRDRQAASRRDYWPPRAGSAPSRTGAAYARLDEDPWAAWQQSAGRIQRPRRNAAPLETSSDIFGTAGCALLLVALVILSLLIRLGLAAAMP